MNKNFVLALIGISIGGIGFGLITPVTVVLLENNHTPSWITGSSTMVGYLSVVLFSGFAGKIIDKYNIRIAMLTGLTIWMIGAALHVFWYVYPLLYAVKFFMGIGGTFVFVATEVTINHYSNETNRGKNIGLYVVLLSVGIAVGTLLIWTIKFGDWVPFIIGAVIMFLVVLLQYFLFEPLVTNAHKQIISKLLLKQMPLIGLVSSMVYGLFESSVIVALPIYGLRSNFTSEEVSLFLASFVVGGIILGYLISRLSDKVSKFNLILTIALSLGLLFALPALNANFYFLLAVFFLIGGIVPAFYTVGLNYTIEQVDKMHIAQANGYYIMMYGIGTIAGPLLGAGLVEFDKQNGYWLFSALLCMVFALGFYSLKRTRWQ
ncbi:MAG: MFS transporter [Ignavibacteria bacterium]|nr:MFS transporter [Ignavibacteria bacterium]